MNTPTRIDQALKFAIASTEAETAPPLLAEAIRYSVFPGGARIRPRLCLAVASACGDDRPMLTDAAAASIELLHCASLAHDDLPCFDDAATRRGLPSVHKKYGEALAVLAGDALIVSAFEILAKASLAKPSRLPSLMMIVGQASGMPSGIAAGQGWESETKIDLEAYHQAKTGSLFAGATMAGAAAAGADFLQWREFGQRIGSAYQAADDIKDVVSPPDEIGKPVGQDAAHHRPSIVEDLGVEGAVDRLKDLIAGALAAIPDCPGKDPLRELIVAETKRFVPKGLSTQAA